MYCATRDVFNQGSTKLHLDATSAVNLLVYGTSNADGTCQGATWLIFTREDAPKLSDWLRTKLKHLSHSDPVHNQRVFVTDDYLQELRVLNIVPFRIVQRPGDAVFIPVGCPHQVSISRYQFLIQAQFSIGI